MDHPFTPVRPAGGSPAPDSPHPAISALRPRLALPTPPSSNKTSDSHHDPVHGHAVTYGQGDGHDIRRFYDLLGRAGRPAVMCGTPSMIRDQSLTGYHEGSRGQYHPVRQPHHVADYSSPETAVSSDRNEPATPSPWNPAQPRGSFTYDGTRWVPAVDAMAQPVPQKVERVAQVKGFGPDAEPSLEAQLERLQLSSHDRAGPLTSPLAANPLSPAEPRPGSFRPMNSVARKSERRNSDEVTVLINGQPGTNPVFKTPRGVLNVLFGFSPAYRGDTSLPRNRSADIPAGDNCSLFIMGLPPTTTTHSLLGKIRGVGRVYATHINRPEPEKGHETSAAKVIFFEREAARKFYAQCFANGFHLHGYAARVVWNRIRTAEQGGPKHKSRVLIIAGDSSFVNPASLTEYFQTKLEFQVDEVVVLGGMPGRNVVEYRFGSYRCQAEAAKMALAREYGETVKVYYGEDPCAHPATEQERLADRDLR